MEISPLSPEGCYRIRRQIFKAEIRSCARCDRSYDVAGHPSGVRLRCLGCGEELEETAGEAPRTDRLGKYVVLREIARGGMGIVLEAEDVELRRRVAIKVLKEGGDDPETVKRLHREAAIAAQLSHPNIVTVHEVGMARDASGAPTHFIAMDYVEGETFAQILKEGKTKLPELLRILEDVARAVAYAHAKGVVHRDLKPANVLVEKNSGRVVLTDFGLARSEGFKSRLTRTVAMIGTPQYMAPEQVEGRTRDIGARTDVYALGVILYEILAGKPPFQEETPAKLWNRILKDDPVRPSRLARGIGGELEVICLKAMEKAPAQRYATAGEFADELRRFRQGEPIRARPCPRWRRWARRVRRHPGTTASLTALLLVLAGGGIWAGISRSKLAAERDLRRRREEALRGLSIQWSTIIERKRDLRQLRMAPDRARRELEAAVAAVDGYVRDWPEEPQGYYVRAKGKFYLDDLDEAEQDVRLSVAKRPDFRPGWSLLALLDGARFDKMTYHITFNGGELWKELKEELASAMEAHARGLEPGNEKQQSELWGLPWTHEDEVMDRILRAIGLRYVEEKPAEAWRLLEEGWREYRAEEFASQLGLWARPMEKSVRYLTEAIALAPGYVNAYVNRGIAKQILEKHEDALADFDHAIEIQGDSAAAYIGRGMAKASLKDYAGAITDYDRAITFGWDDPGVYNARGSAKQSTGDLDGAITDYDRAITMQKNYRGALVNRAGAKGLKGDPQGAIADYDRAIALGEDDARTYNNRGSAKAMTGDRAGAIIDFGRAIERKPGFLSAHSNRGLARLRLGDRSGAAADFTEALRLAPADWPLRSQVEAWLKEAKDR